MEKLPNTSTPHSQAESKQGYGIEYLRAVQEKLLEFLKEHQRSGYTKKLFKDLRKATNTISGHDYGIYNDLNLSRERFVKGFDSNIWLNSKDVSRVGAYIKKGEKSIKAVRRSDYTYFDESNKDITEQVKEARSTQNAAPVRYHHTTSKLVTYSVFNKDQINGLPENFAKEPEVKPTPEKEIPKKIEELTSLLQIKVTHAKAVKSSQYDASTDTIKMPLKSSLQESEYINSILPLIAEATGHSSRLNRVVDSLPQSKGYLTEKLSNELVAASFARELGFIQTFTKDPILLAEFERMLKADGYMLSNASTSANRAIRFIHQKQQERQLVLQENNKTHKDKKLEKLEEVQAKKETLNTTLEIVK